MKVLDLINGKKTASGIVAIGLLFVAERAGITVDDLLKYLAYALAFIGQVHRHVKETAKDAP